MDNITQYYIVIAVYFIAMLGFGFFFSNKNKNDKDYFLARGKLGPAVIGFSFSATQMSGSTYMGAIGSVKVLGFNFIPAAISSAAAPWFSYILVGDRMRKISARLKSVTPADVLEARYYSKSVSLIASIIMLIAFVPMIAAQLKAAANTFEVILKIPYLPGLFLFGGIVIVYTVLGGMFAVAWTDLIQGILMIAGFAILAPVAVNAAGGFAEMHQKYTAINPKGMDFTGIMPLMWVISAFLVWGFFQIGGQPASVVRFLIPADDKTLRKAMVYSVLFQSFIFICFSILAVSGGVLLPDLKQVDLTVPMMIEKLLPPILGGVVLAGALGAMMSTVDSVLLLAGALVVENVYKKFTKTEPDEKKTLNLGRIVTLVIGLLGLAVAINPPAAILWIVTMSFSLMASAFTFPLLLGLWWPGATREGGIAGMIGGAVMCVVWYVIGFMQYNNFNNWMGGIWPAIIGPAVSLVLLIVVSKLTKPTPAEVQKVFFDDILVESK